MSEILLVMTNLPDAKSAKAMTEHIIQSRAATCVNQLAACTSTYLWENKIVNAQEIPLLIKTTRAAYPQLEKLIRTAHPYDLPEIIALPVTLGLPAYLSWVASEIDIRHEEK